MKENNISRSYAIVLINKHNVFWISEIPMIAQLQIAYCLKQKSDVARRTQNTFWIGKHKMGNQLMSHATKFDSNHISIPFYYCIITQNALIQQIVKVNIWSIRINIPKRDDASCLMVYA